MINVHHQVSNMKTFLWNSDIRIKAVYVFIEKKYYCKYTDSNSKNGNHKLVHVPFGQTFRPLIWDDVTIIFLLFSFCRVKKKDRNDVEFL